MFLLAVEDGAMRGLLEMCVRFHGGRRQHRRASQSFRWEVGLLQASGRQGILATVVSLHNCQLPQETLPPGIRHLSGGRSPRMP